MRALSLNPTRRSAVLLGLLVLAGLCLALQYLHRPAQRRLDAALARLERLRDGVRHVEAVAAVGESELKERLRLYERRLGALERLIPATDEVGGLLRAMSDAEERIGVEVTMMRPRPLEESDHYDRLSYELTVRGSYHAIGSFLAAIASLARIVTPDQLTMTAVGTPAAGDGHGDASVVASFRIRTYVTKGPDAIGGAESSPNAAAPAS